MSIIFISSSEVLYYPPEHSLPSSSAPAVSFQFQSCKLGNITSAAVPHKLIIDRIITKDMLMAVAISLQNAACRDASELRLVMLSLAAASWTVIWNNPEREDRQQTRKHFSFSWRNGIPQSCITRLPTFFAGIH